MFVFYVGIEQIKVIIEDTFSQRIKKRLLFYFLGKFIDIHVTITQDYQTDTICRKCVREL